MRFLITYDDATGRVIGVRTHRLNEQTQAVEAGYSTAVVESAPVGVCWFDGGKVVMRAKPPSPGHAWSWETKSWSYSQDQSDARIFQARLDALAAIDNGAGNARLKYITSVPGQSETYQRKEDQARAYAATGFTGTAPSFIAAEAEALGVGAQAVAEEVIQLADYWGNVKGPEIEACRRKWKVAIDAAGVDHAAIDQACAEGLAEIAQL